MDSHTSALPWVKLWTSGFLDGTIRYDNNAEERAFYVDLLLMAALSRINGVVCIGQTKGKINPYTEAQLSRRLQLKESFVHDTLKLFVEQDRIEIKDGAIYIKGWSKYQSAPDYSRQARYRNKKRAERLGQKVTPGDVTTTSNQFTPRAESESEDRKRRGDDTKPQTTPPPLRGAQGRSAQSCAAPGEIQPEYTVPPEPYTVPPETPDDTPASKLPDLGNLP